MKGGGAEEMTGAETEAERREEDMAAFIRDGETRPRRFWVIGFGMPAPILMVSSTGLSVGCLGVECEKEKSVMPGFWFEQLAGRFHYWKGKIGPSLRIGRRAEDWGHWSQECWIKVRNRTRWPGTYCYRIEDLFVNEVWATGQLFGREI